MVLKIVGTTEIQSRTADIIRGLRSGDTFLIERYNEIVGYMRGIGPDLPEDILAIIREKERILPEK